MTLSILIILCIMAAIGLGYVLKINIGLFAICFAYFIASFGMDMRIKDIVGLWPLNLFFVIMAISFFYGFAIANGTLEKVAHKCVYTARKAPWSIPLALYALVTVGSGIGPGPYAVYVFLSPLVMAIAAQTGMSRLLGAIIVVGGGVAGAFTRMSVGGGIARGLIERAGYSPDLAESYTFSVLVNSFLAETIIFLIAYVILKGYTTSALDIAKPEPFSKQQKTTLLLIMGCFLAVILPAVLANYIPSVKLFVLLRRQLDPIFVSIVGIVLALLFKIGNEKEALAKVPWGVIILLCGMGMLIEVAVKAGTIKGLATWMAAHVDARTAPLAIGMVAGVMSFFSSTMGVVMPTLYPIVPNLAEAVDASPATFFSIITVCAAFTGFSPFSSGGSLSLTGVTDEKERQKLFNQLLFLPIAAIALALLLTWLGIIR